MEIRIKYQLSMIIGNVFYLNFLLRILLIFSLFEREKNIIIYEKEKLKIFFYKEYIKVTC